jgi:hypothetical protein
MAMRKIYNVLIFRHKLNRKCLLIYGFAVEPLPPNRHDAVTAVRCE